MKLYLVLALLVSGPAFAQIAEEVDRDPSSLMTVPVKRNYPGGADEEDLKVQASIPDVLVRTDARGIQREVFKTLYNQELKDESHSAVEE